MKRGRALGIQHVVFHKRVGISYLAMGVKKKTFERLRNFRAGIEGNISELKRAFGADFWCRLLVQTFGADFWCRQGNLERARWFQGLCLVICHQLQPGSNGANAVWLDHAGTLNIDQMALPIVHGWISSAEKQSEATKQAQTRHDVS